VIFSKGRKNVYRHAPPLFARYLRSFYRRFDLVEYSRGQDFQLFRLELTAGIVVFPLAYVFGDVLTEVYGYAATRRVVWTGFAALLLMILLLEIGKALPPWETWPHQQAFENVFASTARICLGSVLGFLCGEFTNAYVLARMKVAEKGKRMAKRFVVSTVVGEFIDSAVFFSVAYLGVIPPRDLFGIFLLSWALKVVWEAAALVFSVPLARWLKKVENEDHFDKRTDFNPFRLDD
jgi:uncharacterized integral membrane protein (TIGR00697 family)